MESTPIGVAIALESYVGLLFIWAAAAKLRAMDSFAQAIEDFGLPRRFAPFLAAFVPSCEVALAIGLAFAPLNRASILGMTLMLLVFIGLIGRAVLRGDSVDCNCFGQNREPVTVWSALRNAFLIATLLTALAIQGEPLRSGIGAFVSVLAGAALLGLHALTGLILQMGRRLAVRGAAS